MQEATDKLQQQLRLLEEENRQLKDACQQLQSSQEGLEQAIGDTNAKLLRSEMTSMELEQVFSACTDALWVIREDGIVVRANQPMLDLLRKPISEVVGHNCSDLLDYQYCHSEQCPLLTSRTQKQEFDIQLTGKSGEQTDHILATAPLVTLDGSPGIVGQFKDITSRKKAEKELAEANRVLKRMASVDGLTQIANRRCFDETLQQEWQRQKRNQLPLSLIIGDIDFFKKYNDYYGHQAGDDCLQQISKALADSVLRPADLVARYGGEEFVILLPEIDQKGALQVGERVMANIAQLSIEHQASEVSSKVTMSIGTSTLVPTSAQSLEALIALADKALYQAKEQGRNRITPAPVRQLIAEPE